MKILRNLAGIALLLGWTVHDMRAASPHEAGIEGMSLRGAGAKIRGRLDRVTALAQATPAAARPAIDELLSELHVRRGDAEDPLDGETLDSLARELMALRTRLALGEVAVAEGFRREFVASVAPAAAWADFAKGVPASITIAQAILESGWGRSAPGFNLFGMKGEGPAGSNKRRVVEYKNGRRRMKTASFRAYDSVDGSLDDHAAILANSRHYAKARAVAEDTTRYAQALQGTYATDPRYAGKLVGMIERYGLDRFDWNARSPWR